MPKRHPLFRLGILCAVLLLPLSSVAAQITDEPKQTQIILLGTGTPYPDPNASGPATAVVVGSFHNASS